MMKCACEGHPELLQEYIDDELNEVETILLEEHLMNCSSCRRELNQLILVDWQLRRINRSVEIPEAELSKRRQAALAECLEDNAMKDSGEIKDLYNVQISAFRKSVEFMQFLPGAKLSRKLGDAGKDYISSKFRLGNIISNR